MSSTRKLLLHFSHFFSAGTITLLIGFVTFPILTRLLTREEYGILGLVTNTIAIAVAIAKGGLSDGIIRFYREYATSPERLTLFTSTVLTRGVLLTAVIVGLYVANLSPIKTLIGVDPRFLGCFLVMGLYLFVRPLNIIVLNYLRALGKTFLYGAVNVVTKVSGILLAFALMLWIVGELYGYFLGIALAEVGATFFLYRWLLSQHRFSVTQVSGPLALKLFKFGLPLLLTELAYLLLSYTDRYMIVAYHGESVLGLYTVGYNVASYINDLVMFSLSYAVVPIYTELYVREGKEATEKFLSRSLNYYFMIMIPLTAGYAAVSRDALVTLASAKYAEAADFSPIVLAGLVFLGMNSILYAGLYLERKSVQILSVMLAAVIINIGANVILLPSYGAMGAAIATLIACIVSSVLMTILGRRYVSVHISGMTLVYYPAVSGLMYLLISRIDTGQPALNLLVKIPLGVVIVGAAMWWREADVRTQGRRLIAKVFD